MLRYILYFTHKEQICPMSHIFFVFTTLLFLHTSIPVSAQVNVFTGETMKQLKGELGWYGNINIDLTYKTGNTELLTLRTRFRTDYRSNLNHGFIFGSLQQGRKDGTFFTNKGMAHARIIRETNKFAILIESFLQKQFNESILLNDRNLFGGGLRFAVRSPNSKNNFYFGTGVMWEHELINDANEGKVNTHIIRSTNYVNWTAQLDERVSTSATGYYQVHVRRIGDFRILFEGSLSFNLTKKLSFPLRVNFRYDNEPPTGIKKHDLEIFNGLSYTF